MKESTLIVNFKRAEKERLQNNRMINALVGDMSELQHTFAGFIKVIQRLPGYDEVIKEIAAEHEAAKLKEEAEAAEAEAKTLDLGEEEDG